MIGKEMILCCGEALIDMVPTTLSNGTNVLHPIAGGAVFNTAIALGRLGEQTGFMCGVSNDLFGEIIIDALKESNVDTSFTPRKNLTTTLAFVELTNGKAEYHFYDENTALRMIEKSDFPHNVSKFNTLHVGAISLVSEPCGTLYEDFLIAHSTSKLISIDPNIRPSFIKDEAAYRSRILNMMSHSDIIKLSDEDLEWLHPGISFEDIASSYLINGASILVITCGSDGAHGFCKSGKTFIPSEEIIVADTIGAGDTFDAGFLAQLKRQGNLDKDGLVMISVDDLTEALTFANKVAAITVSRDGANPPWEREISNLKNNLPISNS